MISIEVTIGWTRSDMENGYSSFGDGYRPGASQHTETVTVNAEFPNERKNDLEWATLEIAEAAFRATNSPEPHKLTELPGQIYQGIVATGYTGRGAHYSLSVGDTVTVGEVMLACQPFGWERVTAEWDPHGGQKHRFYEEN